MTTRTPEEEAECAKAEQEFSDLQCKVCAQVENAARRGATAVTIDVFDIRQLLHVLSITPFKVKTVAEAAEELRKRKHRPPPAPAPLTETISSGGILDQALWGHRELGLIPGAEKVWTMTWSIRKLEDLAYLVKLLREKFHNDEVQIAIHRHDNGTDVRVTHQFHTEGERLAFATGLGFGLVQGTKMASSMVADALERGSWTRLG